MCLGRWESLCRAYVVPAIVSGTHESPVMVMVRRMVMVMAVMVVMGGGVGGRCSRCCCRRRRGAVRVGVAVAGRLPLAVLLVLHPPVLEPDLHLTLRQVQIARQLPALLLGDVGVEEELLLQLQRLELGVGFPLLADCHLARPFQRVRA